ncbi:MAG: molecular chaperone DnaK, partial [Parasphingorhabdus sp.]
ADLKGQIEEAVKETKEAIEGGDPEAMKTKSEALAQVSMQMGQKIYEAEQAAGGDAADAAAADAAAKADDDVVDAEFSEVDDAEDDKKDDAKAAE